MQTNSTYYGNVILDRLVNNHILNNMSISPVFTFAPVPLTGELSPLAHAAALARRRQVESQAADGGPIRHRIRPSKKMAETAV